MKKSPSIAIIGTGFSGLGMAIKLKEAGFNNFVIYEQNDNVGGTWYINNYPGCGCDVQSSLYSFSFEQNPNWSRMFAPQKEIHEYLRGCVDKYDLWPHIRLKTMVTGARYNDENGEWTISSCDTQKVWDYRNKKGLKPGDGFDAADPDLPAFNEENFQFLISGMGGLSTPAYPTIKGIETFTGRAFHSQDWDHDYNLNGKRVAVIGTGASAIQLVPEVAKAAARLDLYQRTPPWIVPKPDRAITAAEKLLFRAIPKAQDAFRQSIYWSLEGRVLGFVKNPRILKLGELQARRHIRNQIKDKALRKKVTPDFAFGCKRVLISNNYYPALAQDNVDVITDGIREVRGDTIVDNAGQERKVDCIIYGTGFRAQDPIPKGVVFGKGGKDLLDVWKEGPEAYKGTTISGFPNFFILMGPNTGLGHSSMVYMIESQVNYVLDALKQMERKGWNTVDVKPETQRSYNEDLQSRLDGSVWHTGCQSWYVNESGRNTTLWPGFTWQFRKDTKRFDAQEYECES